MKKPYFSPWTVLVLAAVASLLLHTPLLQDEIRGWHAWRQAQTVWNIRNFERHDANILNPRVSHFNSGDGNIVRYEFPIMQWSIAMVQRVVGDHIAVIRGCVFLMTLLSIWGFYRWLLVLDMGPRLAALGAVLLLFSPLLHTYAVSPLPDILALAGAIWYLYGTLAYVRKPGWGSLLLSSLALLVATGAKLPFLLFSIVSIYLFFQSIVLTRRLSVDMLRMAAVQLLLVAPALAWYAWVMPTWTGNPIVAGIFDANADWNLIGDILAFYAGTMLPSVVLNPILVLPFLGGFFFLKKVLPNPGWIYGLLVLTVLYVVLECTALGTFHDYYFLPFLPWMYLMVVVGIKGLALRYPRIDTLATGIVLSVAVVVVSHLLVMHKWALKHSGYNNDLYIHREKLQSVVPDTSLCAILNDPSYYQFSYMIDKMGYIFQNDYLPAPWLADMIDNKQVRYLYSDSRVVDESPDIQPYLDTLLLEAGTIRVFRLVAPNE